ncbi:hypothetical protein B0H67DRAFT_380205 [Lasiosphaeris hirsuta]|uniref:Uncharacterized protein n=1 Tax=Lasiosphaeris hirsuta TaxID=260670 RepID=A0AA40DL62_9PEZI|nr:hypothetical protein B0H67DRAFT_380205 [Lasiosphaeris hirsuta]
MSAAVVDLGSISVATKQSLLSLTLSSSFSIALPSLWPQPLTAAELCRSSKAGDIWIAKGGSCQIDFRALVNDGRSGSSNCDHIAASKVVHMAAECPIWKSIGLELRVKHTVPQVAPDQYYPQTSYFLHHPDLSSEMIAPSHVPLARFQGLTCELSFHLHNDEREAKAAQHNTTPQVVAKDSAQENWGHHYNLRRDPRPTKKVSAVRDDSCPESITASRQVGQLEQDSLGTTSPSKSRMEIGDMVSLLDVALRRLTGVERVSPGIKTTRSMPSPSLIDIAPGVWNLRYLQSLETHARIIPIIANGMARLTNARSASLREKLDKFTRTRAPNNPKEGAGEDNLTRDEVKKTLWSLCQTGVRADPISKDSKRKKQKLTKTQEQVPIEDPHHTGFELGEFGEAHVSSYQRDIGIDVLVDNGLYSQMAGHDPFSDVSRETSALVVHEEIAEFGNSRGVSQDECTQDDPKHTDMLEWRSFYELTPYDPYTDISSWQYQDGTTWEGGFREGDDEFLECVGDETHSEVSTDGTESVYFYADGQGNYYPVEKEEIAVSAALDWPSGSQLFGVSSRLQDGEVEQDEYRWQLEPS